MNSIVRRVSPLLDSDTCMPTFSDHPITAIAREEPVAACTLIATLSSPARLTSWQLYAFLYLAITIGSTVRLSRPDLQSVSTGLLAIFLLLLLINFFTTLTGLTNPGAPHALHRALALSTSLIFFALIINTALAALLSLTARALGRTS